MISSNPKFMLTPLAAAVSAAVAPTGTSQAQSDGAAAIEEIVVTARKREENLQGIPADIQAISQIVLDRMGAKGIEDYSRFIPSVNVVSYEPAFADIVFRGVTTGSTGIAQSPASLYVDELPLTISGLQPEVRMVDIRRVESLAGPQGTLFGAAAQSGTLRVITNQPDPSQFEAVVDVSVKQGEDTDFSHDVTGVINLPFADGKAALRLVGFQATEAGFIDNVYGHTPDSHQWYDLSASEWGDLDNAAVVKDDWNSTDFVGGRVALRYEFNDRWAATVGYIYQKTESEGDHHYDPYVGDLKVVKFNDGYTDDEWSNFNLTIEADLGWAQLVSATSYFDRTLLTLKDSTVYTKYYQAWGCLYQWDPTVYTGYFVDPTTGAALFWPRYCHGPSSLSDTLIVQENNWWQDKFTQEIRLSADGDRLSWIVGLFYERSNDDEESDWGRPTSNSYQDSVSLRYWEWASGTTFPNARHTWESIDNVDWEHVALFGELTWHINDNWTAGIGGRVFEQTNDTEYWVENPEDQFAPEYVNNRRLVTGKTDDFVPKFTLSYQLDDDKMVYTLYSEGFRPGGTNRGRGNPFLPLVYQPDKLKNAEIGAKTRWADGRVQANLTYYDMSWEDYQLQIVDPSYLFGEPWQQVVANVGDASVEGVQLELQIAVTDSLDFGLNAISLNAETDTSVDLDPGSAGTFDVPAGSRLPLSAEFKASAWLDYDWEVSVIPGTAFARLQFSHTGDSLNQITPPGPLASAANPQIKTPSYTIADFRIGLITDADWQVDFFVSNFTDERASYTEASGFFEIPFSSVQDGRAGISRIYTNRPREYGIRFSKRWTD